MLQEGEAAARPPDTLIATVLPTRDHPRAPLTRTRPQGRIAGLDGLRAIAVILVVAYHLAPATVRGGYVGVDVFFVLSGFLITTILLRERLAHGRISLRRFWIHRARRLLPALALTVAGSLALVTTLAGGAALAGTALEGSAWGDLLVGVPAQVAAAATFTSNWVTVALGQSYAAASSPHLFENLWSLAVEEQFYLAWPLAVVVVTAAGLGMRRAALGALALAGVSAVTMAALAPAGADPTRAYMGTDSHAFGLMIGAALALWWAHPAAVASIAARPARAVTVGLGGALTLGMLAAAMPWDSPWTMRGGLVLASLAAAAVIHMVVAVPALGDALDAPLLRWIGDRSYAIYLWHWPLLVILATGIDGGRVREPSVFTVLLTVACTLAAAAASARWVEMPVRRVGLRRASRLLLQGLRGGGDDARATRVRRRAWTVTAGGALVLGLATTALALAPTRTALEVQLEAGAAAAAMAEAPGVAAGPAIPAAATTPAAVPAPGEAPGTVLGLGEVPWPARVPSPDALPGTLAERIAAAVPERRSRPPAGEDVTVIGDSVALASAPALVEALPGVAIDAEVGRQFWSGVDTVDSLAAQSRLRDYVVVALGTNGEVRREDMARLIAAVDGRPLVLVTPHGDRSWIPGAQRAVREAARRHPNVVVADWERRVTRDPGLVGSDGIHPDAEGTEAFAAVIRGALARATALD